MKRVYCLTIFIVLSCLLVPVSKGSVRDSLLTNSSFWDNTFIQTGAGVSTFMTPSMNIGFNGNANFIFDASVGKWFSPYVGFRVGYQGFHFSDYEKVAAVLPGANFFMSTYKGEPSARVRFDYSYLHGDLLWNISNHLFGYKEKRLFEVSPYAHLGYIWLYNSYSKGPLIKGDFSAGLGAIGSFRLSESLSAFADLRSAFIIRHTTDLAKMAMSYSLLFGVSYDFTTSSWQKIGHNSKGGYGITSFIDNTFVGLGVGLLSYNVFAEKAGLNGRYKPLVDIYAGKWFTPSVGGRIGFSYSRPSFWSDEEKYGWNLAYEKGLFAGRDMFNSTFGLFNIHGDLMWNMSNSLNGYNEYRLVNFIPYLSFNSAFSQSVLRNVAFRRDFLFGGGLMTNIRLSERFGINFDVRALYLSDRKYANTNKEAAMITSYTLGTTYSFGNSGWKYHGPYIDFIGERRSKKSEGYIMNYGFFDNSFVSLFTGLNAMLTPGTGLGFNSRITPSMEVSFGKMITPVFGARLGVQGMRMAQFGVDPIPGVSTYSTVRKGNNVFEEEIGFIYPHIDVLFYMNNMLGKYKPERFYNLVAYPHAGYVQMFSDNSNKSKAIAGNVGIGAGLLNKFRLSDRASIDFDMRWTTTPAVVERNTDWTNLFTAQVGLAYNLGATSWLRTSMDNPYIGNTRSSGKSTSGYVIGGNFFNNTFASVTMGTNLLWDNSLGNGFNSHPSLALDINFGKWITPYLGVIAGYQGRDVSEWGSAPIGGAYSESGTFKGKSLLRESSSFDYYYLGAKADLMNIFAGYKEKRIYSLQPYLQAGAILLSSSGKTTVTTGVGGGLQNNFNVSKSFALNLDLRGTKIVEPVMDANSKGAGVILSALAGVSYKFGESGWRMAIVPLPVDEADSSAVPVRRWAISTNVFGYLDLGTINVEAQYALSRHFSLDIQGKYNPFTFETKSSDKAVMDKKLVASAGVKYWPWYVYSGLWMKGALQTESSAFGGIFKKHSPEKANSYGLALAGGYSLALNPWLNLDFGLGVYGGYKTYRRYENTKMDTVKYRSSEGFITLGEASVSLMFVF